MKSLTFLLLCLCCFFGVVSAQTTNLEQMAPKEAYVVVNLPHLPQAWNGFKGTWMGKMFFHPETQTYLQPLLNVIENEIQKAEQEIGLNFRQTLNNFSGQILFALSKISPAGPAGTEALLAAHINNPSEIQGLINRAVGLIQQMDPQLALSNPVVEGVNTTCLTDSRANVSLYYAILDNNILLVTIGKTSFENAIRQYRQNTPSLNHSENYQWVKNSLTSGNLTALTYVNFEAILKDFGGMMPPEFMAIYNKTGLNQIKAAGASLSFQGNSSVEGLYLHIPEPTGVLAACLSTSVFPKYLKQFPDSLFFLGGGSLNLGAIYDEVMELFSSLAPREYGYFLQEYQNMTTMLQFDLRQDLLGSMGTHLFFAGGSTYQHLPFPEGAFSIEVSNGPVFMECLKKLVVNTGGPQIQTMEYQGFTFHYVDLSEPKLYMDTPLQLTACLVQPNMVLLTINVNTMKNILTQESRGNLPSKPDFAELMRGADANLILFEYLELSKGMDFLHGFLTYAVATREFRRDLPMLNPALFPSRKTFTKGFSSVLCTVSKHPKGVALKISSPIPLLPTLFGLGTVGFMAASSDVYAQPKEFYESKDEVKVEYKEAHKEDYTEEYKGESKDEHKGEYKEERKEEYEDERKEEYKK